MQISSRHGAVVVIDDVGAGQSLERPRPVMLDLALTRGHGGCVVRQHENALLILPCRDKRGVPSPPRHMTLGRATKRFPASLEQTFFGEAAFILRFRLCATIFECANEVNAVRSTRFSTQDQTRRSDGKKCTVF